MVTKMLKAILLALVALVSRNAIAEWLEISIAFALWFFGCGILQRISVKRQKKAELLEKAEQVIASENQEWPVRSVPVGPVKVSASAERGFGEPASTPIIVQQPVVQPRPSLHPHLMVHQRQLRAKRHLQRRPLHN